MYLRDHIEGGTWPALRNASSCSDQFEVHIVRGDATNSAAAQRSKVHFCTAISSYHPGSVDEDNASHLSERRTCVADLQFIPTGCTSEKLFGIYQVQIQSMGVPALNDACKHTRIYTMVTDDGPDQKGCEKLVVKSMKDNPASLFCRFKCLLHQLHLIVGKQLKRLNPLGYYSKIAKIINVWRSCGTPRKIFRAYSAMHGEQRAKEVASRLPPRALRGRWGSITAAEEFLLKCGHAELPAIFCNAVGEHEGHGEDDAQEALVVDLSSVEVCDVDSAVYRQVMGRWRRESIAAVRSNDFWIVLSIANTTKRPIDHFMRWLMSTSDVKSDTDDMECVTAVSASAGKLAPLLFGKLDSFLAEFSDHILDAEGAHWNVFRALVASGRSEQSESDWVACLVGTALEIAAELHRRVEAYFSEFPGRLAWMIFQPPDEPCEARRTTASYFLACHDLDKGFSAKLRSRYLEDFKDCAKTGTISCHVHNLLSDAGLSLALFCFRCQFSPTMRRPSSNCSIYNSILFSIVALSLNLASSHSIHHKIC